jgi:hypothetical protein
VSPRWGASDAKRPEMSSVCLGAGRLRPPNEQGDPDECSHGPTSIASMAHFNDPVERNWCRWRLAIELPQTGFKHQGRSGSIAQFGPVSNKTVFGRPNGLCCDEAALVIGPIDSQE